MPLVKLVEIIGNYDNYEDYSEIMQPYSEDWEEITEDEFFKLKYYLHCIKSPNGGRFVIVRQVPFEERTVKLTIKEMLKKRLKEEEETKKRKEKAAMEKVEKDRKRKLKQLQKLKAEFGEK